VFEDSLRDGFRDIIDLCAEDKYPLSLKVASLTTNTRWQSANARNKPVECIPVAQAI